MDRTLGNRQRLHIYFCTSFCFECGIIFSLMKKLLIIEDDPILLKMYVDKFKKGDYEIITALDGEAGYGEALKHHPDFIILDLRLPNTDGIEILKRLKATPKIQDIPVAALTVLQQDIALKNDPEFMKKAVAYWRKDETTPSEVFQKVEDLLKNHG